MKQVSYTVSSQVWFLFPSKDFECSGLANTISSYQSQDLSRARGGQPVELKRVGTVAVGGVLLQIARQVDNGDGLKWTFLQGKVWHLIAAGQTQRQLPCPTFTHMPQPMHSVSEMVAILSTGVTSMHSLPENM